jgi:cellobiose phosphorylase
VTQWILGIRPGWDGLVIDPCIPEHWDGYDVTRHVRGDVYRISVRNPNHVSKGVVRMAVDGSDIACGPVPFAGDGAEHSVEVELG